MSSISIIEHNMTERLPLINEKQDRYFHPERYVQQDFDEIYNLDKVEVGLPVSVLPLLDDLTRDHTVAINGAQFGDEGKGRFVDNKLNQMLSIPGVKKAYVVRYQGGSNAGHTVYTDKEEKIPLHQLTSSVNEENAVGIMDTGMIIHMEDLRTEIIDAEAIVGDLRGKLILSEQAKLCTDLERAEEIVNRFKSSGKSEGGTGRGISPTYANDLSRLGTQVKDLFEENWREVYTKRYERYQKEFAVHGFDLETMDVPDLKATRETGKAQKRTVGSINEFLDRMEEVRKWYLDRDASMPDSPSMIQNTFELHEEIYQDASNGILFEGAQAIGLHHAIGRVPDVTSSDTSVNGVIAGTKFWRPEDIKEKIGIWKVPYMSSVGSMKMPTHIDLPREAVTSTEGFTQEQQYGLWVREEAHERGTTTGRYRDMTFLDLPIMRYNIRMGGIELLAGTHLDIARENVGVKVCTHYVDRNNKPVSYQPGMHLNSDIKPVYIELPGWDGKAVQNARSFDEIPDNAKKFLAFVQKQTGTPIIAATTGPQRHHLVEMPKIQLPPKQYRAAA